MKNLYQELLHGQDGVAMLIVLGFMALSVPMVTGILSFSGTLSKDSQTKAAILQSQYSAQGCTQYASYRLTNEDNYATNLVEGVPDVYNFDSCTITVTKVANVPASEVAYADIVLLLDVTVSLDTIDLGHLKQAANNFVDAFSLGNADGRVRIGVVRFRGSAESVVNMTDVDQHGVSEPLHNGINGLLWGGPGLVSGTNFVTALNASGVHFATGLGDRVDPPFPVPNLVVVITDGDDDAGNGNNDIKDASNHTGAEVFVVGVGGNISSGTRNSIASEATSQYRFTATDYSDLLIIINDVFSSVSGSSAVGTLITIESVSADGTVSISEVILQPE